MAFCFKTGLKASPEDVSGCPVVPAGHPIALSGVPFDSTGHPVKASGHPFVLFGHPFGTTGRPLVSVGRPKVPTGDRFVSFGCPVRLGRHPPGQTDVRFFRPYIRLLWFRSRNVLRACPINCAGFQNGGGKPRCIPICHPRRLNPFSVH